MSTVWVLNAGNVQQPCGCKACPQHAGIVVARSSFGGRGVGVVVVVERAFQTEAAAALPIVPTTPSGFVEVETLGQLLAKRGRGR